MRNVLAFLVLISTAFATVTLLEPNYIDPVPTNELYLGNVMPGQTLELIFSRSTGTTGQQRAIFWETATATIPGKETVTSELRGAKLSLKIKIPETHSGKYAFSIKLEGIQLRIIQPEIMKFWVDVRPASLYNIELSPEYHLNAGESNVVPVKIISSSVASDTLTLTDIEGMPLGWFNRQPVYLRYMSEREMTLDIAPFEEGAYSTTLHISRASNDVVNSEQTVFRVTPTLKSKLKAYGEGIAIVPVILQPFYSLMALLGSVFP
jgi:hypothetical protein